MACLETDMDSFKSISVKVLRSYVCVLRHAARIRFSSFIQPDSMVGQKHDSRTEVLFCTVRLRAPGKRRFGFGRGADVDQKEGVGEPDQL